MFRKVILRKFSYFFALTVSAVIALQCGSLMAYGTEIGFLEDTLSSDGACYQECSLGDAAADAARLVGGTQIAIINGGDLSSDLARGAVTEENLDGAFLADKYLMKGEITPKELKELLEGLLSYLTVDETDNIDVESSLFVGFPQISGFSIEYDLSAPVGSRTTSLTLDSGEQINLTDDETELTITGTEALFDGTFFRIDGGIKLDDTLRSAFSKYIVQSGALTVPEVERMTVKGIGGKKFISYVPTAAIIIAVVLLAVIGWLRISKKEEFYSFDNL